MKISIDTNVLVRLLTEELDDGQTQKLRVIELFDNADEIFVPTTVLCETVWVLHRSYEKTRTEIYEILQMFLDYESIIFVEDEVQAGLDFLQNNGDFADGVNMAQAQKSGAQCFFTFDKKSIHIGKKQGFNVAEP